METWKVVQGYSYISLVSMSSCIHVHIHTYIHISTVKVEWKDPTVVGPGVTFSAWPTESMCFTIVACLTLASRTIRCVHADLRDEASLSGFPSGSSLQMCFETQGFTIPSCMSCKGEIQISGSCTDWRSSSGRDAWACEQMQLELHWWDASRLTLHTIENLKPGYILMYLLENNYK